MTNPAIPSNSTNIIDSLPDCVATVDVDEKITSWNKTAENLTGWLAADVIGKSFRSQVRLVSAQNETESYSPLEEAVTSGRMARQHGNTILISKNKVEIPIDLSAAPIHDSKGKISGLVIAFRDITLEKKDFRLRSDFSFLAHQLRTPLGIALWNLQLVVNSQTLEKQTLNRVQTALAFLDSVNVLCNRLIEVTQIDQGLVVPKAESVFIDLIVKNAITGASTWAKEKAIKINYASDNKQSKIMTDLGFCTNILVELLHNAIQYSDSKTEIDIQVTSNYDGVVFEITDRGNGIRLDEQSLVFTKFFRGSNISREIPGAGLGLYTVLRYVKLLHGKIWFTSKENQGSTFFVLLPRSD